MEGVSIISYNPAYFDRINEFWNQTGLGGSFRGDNKDIIADTLEAGGHLEIMVTGNDEVIGTSWLTNDKRRTYIHHFGIAEKYRNNGLANQLLEHSLKLAYADGYQVKLEVHKDNIPAISLYKKYGFKYLGEYEVLIKREIDQL
jgi:[ribosomal protein S18]-alanine N-acetyltransferase